MSLKIVHIVNYFQPQLGYQEYFLAKAFKEMGHESHVVTSNYYFPYPDYKRNFQTILGNRKLSPGRFKELGITTLRLPTLELVSGSQVLLQHLSKTLDQLKPDLVICHNPYLLISYQIARLKQKFGFKLIFDTHAAAFNTNLNDTLAKRIYMLWFVNFAVPPILKAADGFFAIGESEREMLEQTFKFSRHSVPIIRLGVDTTRFKYAKVDRDEVRRQLNINRNDILLIYAGKVTPNKDVHVLVKALGMLSPKYKLVILGAGLDKYLEQIKRLKLEETRLITLDAVPNQELPKYFSAADIGVWPGDPALTMLEALVTSLPLVVAATHETDYLKSHGLVYRFTRGDVQSLAETIGKITLIPEKKRIIQQKQLENQFSWQNKAKQVLNLLKTQEIS